MKLIDLLVKELKYWPSDIMEAQSFKKSREYHWVDAGGIAAKMIASSSDSNEMVTIGQWSKALREYTPSAWENRIAYDNASDEGQAFDKATAPASPFAFADQELDFLIQQSRESAEGKVSPRSIASDIKPSIMLGVKKLHDDVSLPAYATDGSNCFDIRCYGEPSYDSNGNAVIKTGLAFEIPPHHCLMIYSRSGQGFNHDVRLSNATGVIDSDYRGEVMVKLTADSWRGQFYLDNIKHGARIAQAMLIPVPHVTLVEIGELSETKRGSGGFNSTGDK